MKTKPTQKPSDPAAKIVRDIVRGKGPMPTRDDVRATVERLKQLEQPKSSGGK